MTTAPVRITPAEGPGQPERTPELEELYRGFESELLVPLWTEIGDLMPHEPNSRAQAHTWRWRKLLPLAERAGRLVPVGRGGERRAIALANPGLGGAPFATPTLWAAIQYLGPREDAPVHRHTQHAFRFVVEGEGVWTVVDGDPVAMRRGDFLLTPGWHFHGHHNRSDAPMAWLDGLDIPLSHYTGSTFFEFGPDEVGDRSTPPSSRSERLWAHPGLTPVSAAGAARPSSPIAAYRWEHTDRALDDQLALEREGFAGVLEPGHAAVRFTNPTTGGDVMPTIRAEFHRLRAGTVTATRREVGSSVYQVFDGSGAVRVGEREWSVAHGDLFAVPSWQPLTVAAAEGGEGLDLFRFSDTPVFDRLHQSRVHIEDTPVEDIPAGDEPAGADPAEGAAR
jgi:gentisate 1,2-dioxygenase